MTGRANIQWCPGCPNNLILKALAKALEKLNLEPGRTCLVSGIGQAAKTPHYLPCNYFNGLHGRALPVALGIKAANPLLTIIVTTGDGDCYGEGGNHFIHTLRRNPDITVIVHDNAHYALTKGQASPTTPLGEARDLHPDGVVEPPLNPLGIAVLQGCGFVARGSALEPDHLADLIAQGIRHPGFALLDVIQPCITWDRHPLRWHKERTYLIGSGHDPGDREKALDLTLESEKMGIGVIFRRGAEPTFGQKYRETVTGKALATLPIPDEEALLKALKPFEVGG